jgi:hypothetical protein
MSIQYTEMPLSEIGDDQMIWDVNMCCKAGKARQWLPPHKMVQLCTGLQEAYDKFSEIERKLLNEGEQNEGK